ncbi:hypothetical protein [Streptomyces sp. NPDC015350]|uniref:hypothetical protein n=1 Tax=Streptomyces sp. NPDC015350 TaxID=3364955 RepID=UPI00370058D2
MTATAIGLAAPISSASAESSWDRGCRGYWYTTSGHGYCSNAQWVIEIFEVAYDCNVEIDTEHRKTVKLGYTGKFDTHECTFKINGTDVSSTY